MFTLKRLIGGVLFLFIFAGTSLAQENRLPIETPRAPVTTGPLVTASATARRVRFVSPGSVVQLRLEVYNEVGQKLFDTELRGGNVLDWLLQDGAGQHLQPGSYACVLTIKSLSGRISQRVATVRVNEEKAVVEAAAAAQLSPAQQQTIGPVEGNAAFTVLQETEAAAITAVTHDGTEGQLGRTRGALTFRLGDFFSGKDKEQMRLTEDGKLGIGTNSPQATLDVAGTIRAERILIAKPGKPGSFYQMSVAETAQAGGGGAAPASGSGTQDRIAKWIDNLGTLGDSGITEIAGNIGIGTTTPARHLSLYAASGPVLQLVNSTTGVTSTDGLQLFQNGLDGYLENQESGSIHIRTSAVNRVAIDAAGNVGIGTTTPTQKLDVVGNIKASGSLTGATGSVTGNLTVDTTTLQVDATNNRVGVGTTTPAQPLDVVGPINSSTGYHIGVGRVLHITGTENTFVGIGAGVMNTGSENTFVGSSAGLVNTTGSMNSFFGGGAGVATTTGSSNSFFGKDAGAATTTGSANSFFGTGAGRSNTTAVSNSFFGYVAGGDNTTGAGNSFFGTTAGYVNTTGSSNSFFGHGAGASNTTASSNSFFGHGTGYSNTTGFGNSFFGGSAGILNTTASDNSFFGNSAGRANTTGSYNSFFGNNAGAANTTARDNAFFGVSAGAANTEGVNNSFIGSEAGAANTTGSSNTFVGGSAGLSNTSESNNTFVGANSNGAAGITNATAIGVNAVVTQSDSLVLGNGVNVGIGPTAPAERLHVRGNIYITGGGPFANNYNGLILKSPDTLTCAKLTINNAGALVTTVIPCP